MLGTIKGGFLCARQTATGWEKIGGGGSAIWFCYGGVSEMELFNVHISKYRGGEGTAHVIGGEGVVPALGMEARRGTPLGVIHDSPAETGEASTQRPHYM